MTDAAQRPMTNEEFFAWAENQEEPFELVDGVPVPLWRHDPAQPTMVAPPSRRHSDIATNAQTAIRSRLRPPCWATRELTVPIGEGSTRIPDVVAACVEHDAASNRIDEPALVVEILSPSTEGADRSVKLDEYHQLGTVREVWLVAGDRRWAQVWRREGDLWQAANAIGRGGFDSPWLGDRITLDELYAGSDL